MIDFGSQLLTVVTGFLFVITATRNLTTVDFGIRQNESNIQACALILPSGLPFSVTCCLSQGYRDAPKSARAAEKT